MSGTVSTRELNRATLERQLLLHRDDRPALGAIGQLVALQAQVPNAPYVGLWSRLKGFRKDDLTGLMNTRKAVRSSMLRGTLQVTTARDYLDLRPALEPALAKAMRGFMGKRAEGLDLEELAGEARALLTEHPYGYGELGATLLKDHPDRDASALAHITLRCQLPVVQKPPGGTWGSGSNATYVNADEWLGSAPGGAREPDELVRRYLAALGPATARDIQTWCGLTGLAPVLKRLRPELDVLRAEDGRELFDLPGAPLPDAGTPAPVRLLPEYDNLLLAHHDRTRVIADEDRPRVFRPGGRVLPTVLADGFVRGVWTLKRERGATRLTVQFFTRPAKRDMDAAASEAERLLAFMTDEANETDEPGHTVDVVVQS